MESAPSGLLPSITVLTGWLVRKFLTRAVTVSSTPLSAQPYNLPKDELGRRRVLQSDVPFVRTM
eukprot:8822834-Karenia_brevis.AAC.1